MGAIRLAERAGRKPATSPERKAKKETKHIKISMPGDQQAVDAG